MMLIDNKPQLTNLGEAIAVEVRTSAKARNISIRINLHKVELVIPERASKNAAYKFLYEKEAWVRRKLAGQQRVEPTVLPPTNQIPILGNNYIIEHIDSQQGLVTLADGVLTVYANENRKTRLLKAYLKQYILNEIKANIAKMAEQHGFSKYGKIAVKELKSRWGSCSYNGNLSFNWRIVFAPEPVFRYLLAHELCHLKQMNHSAKFWKLVAEICPDYQSSRRWLRKHGAELYHYLANNGV